VKLELGSLLVNLSVLSRRPTGISTYALNLLPHLQSLQPHLFSATLFEHFQSHPISEGMTPDYGLKGHLKRLLWLQTQFPKHYQDLNGQLVFSPLPEAPIYTNCRTVITVHDLIPLRFLQNSLLGFYFRYYVPILLKQAKHVLCNSKFTANDIIDFFQISPKKITPIPLAYDASHFRCLNQPPADYFLYLGRIDPYKNIRRLISAFKAVSLCHDVSLWIVGPTDPRYAAQYFQQIEALDLSSRVRFLNYLPYQQLPEVINQAIALVFPSLWEGFGLPVLEAMACGTPVITSNLSSLPEVAGDAAILIDPYNVEQLAAAMIDMVKDCRAREDLRQAGLAQAQRFSWEQTGQQTCEILKQFL
jgi:glycosyltransferase involved in cell wall biosynthesis